jgi:acyl-CoA thioesterase-2
VIRSLFDVVALGDDRFDAPLQREQKRPNLFGGQVAAQALRAAALTVDDGRPPSSLHCLFVRSGRLDVPLVLEVDRTRDGRSFTTRRVEARQEGEVVLAMLATFQVEVTDDEPYGPVAPVVAGPDDPSVSAGADDPDAFLGYPGSVYGLDVRDVPEPVSDAATVRTWVRSTEDWGQGAWVGACYVTYVGDLRAGFAGHPRWRDHLMASLDFSLWFHAPVDPREWLLFDLRRLATAAHRGLVLGSVFSADGRHAASLTQEVMVRPRTTR